MENSQSEFLCKHPENNGSQSIQTNSNSLNKIEPELSNDQMESDFICKEEMKDLCDENDSQNLTKNDDGQKTQDSFSNEQKIRADMRARFLWSCSGLNGKEAEISMYENITIQGICRGMNRDIQHMHLQNMETPLMKYPFGTVRLADCLFIKFKIDK